MSKFSYEQRQNISMAFVVSCAIGMLVPAIFIPLDILVRAPYIFTVGSFALFGLLTVNIWAMPRRSERPALRDQRERALLARHYDTIGDKMSADQVRAGDDLTPEQLRDVTVVRSMMRWIG